MLCCFRNLRQQLHGRIDLAITQFIDRPLRIADLVREFLLGYAALSNVGIKLHTLIMHGMHMPVKHCYAWRRIHYGNYAG